MMLMRNFPEIFRDFDRPFTGFENYRPALKLLPYAQQESENHYHLSFDLPGVGKDNIDIEVVGSHLKVSAQRKVDANQSRSFERVFNLPDGISAESVSAQYENGVLNLSISKPAESKPQKIAIS
jgi:HSP20 family protein